LSYQGVDLLISQSSLYYVPYHKDLRAQMELAWREDQSAWTRVPAIR
jgi:hypothetical protein